MRLADHKLPSRAHAVVSGVSSPAPPLERRGKGLSVRKVESHFDTGLRWPIPRDSSHRTPAAFVGRSDSRRTAYSPAPAANEPLLRSSARRRECRNYRARPVFADEAEGVLGHRGTTD